MITTNALEQRIAEIITPSLARMGYEIVRIRVKPKGEKENLQIMLERVDGIHVSLDDCEKASRQISSLLDVEDVILKAYNLEVSSPGIDRPLTRPKDFSTFVGYEAKIKIKPALADHATNDANNSRQKYTGTILGVDGNNVLLRTKNENDITRINFVNIMSAALVINNELLLAAKK